MTQQGGKRQEAAQQPAKPLWHCLCPRATTVSSASMENAMEVPETFAWHCSPANPHTSQARHVEAMRNLGREKKMVSIP